MIITLLFEVFIKAFLLCILLYIVARDEADFEFHKVTMVTAGIVLGAVILDAALTRFIGLFTLIPVTAFVIFMVMKFCWVRFWRSLLVVIPFLILNFMISSSVTSFQKKADTAIARGLQGPVKEEDMKEAMAFFKQQTGVDAFRVPLKTKAPQVEPTLDQILLKKFVAGIISKQFSLKPGRNEKTPPVEQNQVITEDQPGGASKPPRVVEEPAEPEKDASKPVVTAADWQEAGNKINVKGTLIGKDGVRVAIVNDQMVKEGECVQVEHEKTIYRWRARFIRDKGVSWEPAEALKK